MCNVQFCSIKYNLFYCFVNIGGIFGGFSMFAFGASDRQNEIRTKEATTTFECSSMSVSLCEILIDGFY